MRLALLESDDLVFDRGAIARATARNRAGIDRRMAEIVRDDRMTFRRRMGDEAIDLRM